MIYGLENYDVTDGLEIQTILSELDFNLIIENIKDQIFSLDSTSVNYLIAIENKFEMIKSQWGENEDIIKQATELMENLYETIIDSIATSFNIDIQYSSDDFEELSMMAKVLYNFLILNSRKNIKKFISKYIIKNKKMIIAEYSNKKKKDISSTNLKKITKNKDDVVLLSNLPDIYKSIINMDFDEEDLMRFVNSTDMYVLYMRKYLSSAYIVGNFMSRYMEMIRDDYDLYDDIYSRVYSKLADKLLKK